MHLGPNEKIIAKIKKSRKAYIVEYFCGFFLVVILGIALLKGINLPSSFIFFTVGLALFSMGIGEYSRQLTRYIITDTKIIINHGLVMQTKKNIYFQPLGFIPDLNTKQDRMQRILGYGTVYLRGNNENAFEIKDIDNPDNILRMIEELIEINKNRNN